MTKITTRIPEDLQAGAGRGFIVVESGGGGLEPNPPLSEYEQNTAFEPNGTGGFQIALNVDISSDPTVEESAGNGIQPKL